jgi:hypothetical protein
MSVTLLLFEIHVGKGLPVQIFHHKTGVQFLDGPGLRKVALRHSQLKHARRPSAPRNRRQPAPAAVRGCRPTESGVTVRVIVAHRDSERRSLQVGALMPVNVAASKKTETVHGLVFGRKPHRLLYTDKVTGVLAPAMWARPIDLVSHKITVMPGLA